MTEPQRAWKHSKFVTVTVEIPDWMVAYYKQMWDETVDFDHESVLQSFIENGEANAYDSAREDGFPVDDLDAGPEEE